MRAAAFVCGTSSNWLRLRKFLRHRTVADVFALVCGLSGFVWFRRRAMFSLGVLCCWSGSGYAWGVGVEIGVSCKGGASACDDLSTVVSVS